MFFNITADSIGSEMLHLGQVVLASLSVVAKAHVGSRMVFGATVCVLTGLAKSERVG